MIALTFNQNRITTFLSYTTADSFCFLVLVTNDFVQLLLC